MSQWIQYAIAFAVLSLSAWAYMRVADRFGIVDAPNQRSSHSRATIRGGGIIILLCVLLFAAFNQHWNSAFTGVLIVGVISFLDDVRPLHQAPRLLAQLVAALGLLWSVGGPGMSPFWWILGVVMVIGWINAFNFMDGVNGITVLYATAALLSLRSVHLLVDQQGLIDLLLLSCAVFGFLNFRTRALAFAGDVGSISIAFLLAYLMALLIVRSGQWAYICFFSVYAVDTGMTIIRRLGKKENIFHAHRRHLYQKLANEKRMPHLLVSVLYAFTQLAINFLLLEAIRADKVSLCVSLILSGLTVTYVLCFPSRESWRPTSIPGRSPFSGST